MKKLLIILAFILVASTCLADGAKMIYRDFWVDDKDLKPISFGLCSWTDLEADCQLGGYFNVSLFSFWDNHLRLGVGLAGSSPDEGSISGVDLRLITSASTLFFDCLEIGFYAAPFYNAMGNHLDDPYGLMIGYAFGF